MKLTSRNPESQRMDRRERLRRDRLVAPVLRSAFPALECVRVELTFEDSGAYAPAPQTHVLYPGAKAFFGFPCPYADCGGRFELLQPLNDVIRLTNPEGRGAFECHGVRDRDRLTGRPCGLHVDFTISVAYSKTASS